MQSSLFVRLSAQNAPSELRAWQERKQHGGKNAGFVNNNQQPAKAKTCPAIRQRRYSNSGIYRRKGALLNQSVTFNLPCANGRTE